MATLAAYIIDAENVVPLRVVEPAFRRDLVGWLGIWLDSLRPNRRRDHESIAPQIQSWDLTPSEPLHPRDAAALSVLREFAKQEIPTYVSAENLLAGMSQRLATIDIKELSQRVLPRLREVLRKNGATVGHKPQLGYFLCDLVDPRLKIAE